MSKSWPRIMNNLFCLEHIMTRISFPTNVHGIFLGNQNVVKDNLRVRCISIKKPLVLVNIVPELRDILTSLLCWPSGWKIWCFIARIICQIKFFAHQHCCHSGIVIKYLGNKHNLWYNINKYNSYFKFKLEIKVILRPYRRYSDFLSHLFNALFGFITL